MQVISCGSGGATIRLARECDLSVTSMLDVLTSSSDRRPEQVRSHRVLHSHIELWSGTDPVGAGLPAKRPLNSTHDPALTCLAQRLNQFLPAHS
jgi:hypothetical protein